MLLISVSGIVHMFSGNSITHILDLTVPYKAGTDQKLWNDQLIIN